MARAKQLLHESCAPIDGEGVVCRPDGVSDLDWLRVAVGRKGSRDGFLYAFDPLALDGQDLRREPWETRRATLASLLRKAGNGIRLSELLASTDGETILQHPCAMGLEGIVAKRFGTGRMAPGVRPTESRSRTRTRQALPRVIEG